MKNAERYCIYKHTSPSGKVYIGQTCRDVRTRWGKNGRNYFTKRKDGGLCQPLFAKAIEKYGWEKIIHEILFVDLTKLDADLIEKDLIYYYKKNNLSYNITDGGEGFAGVKRSPELIKLIADKQRGKRRPSHSVSEETRKKISERLKGNTNGKGHKSTELVRAKNRERCKKFLYQFDLDGNLIKIWECQHDAAAFYGCKNASNLLDVADGITYSAYGYRWSRTEELPTYTPAHKHKKCVQQYTLEGILIATYDCIREAAEKTGVHRSGIVNVCKGKLQTSGGYKWKYVDELCQ